MSTETRTSRGGMGKQETRLIHRHRGLTAVELLVTLCIVSLLVTAAVPPFAGLLAREAVKGNREQMRSAFNNTRLLAISLGKRVVICPSIAGERCEKSDDWQQGWIAFVDENRDRDRQPDERLLRHQGPNDDVVRIETAQSRRRLTYLHDGRSPGSNVTMVFCHRDGSTRPLALVISNSGRPRLSNTRPDGSELRCRG